MKNGDGRQAVICASVWLFNPLSVTVSTRGNAESLMSVLVLFTLFMLARGGYTGTLISAVTYGLSVHMKIYPVTYALALYLHINEYRSQANENSGSSWYRHLRCIWPTSAGVLFGTVSLLACLFASLVCYNWWVVLYVAELDLKFWTDWYMLQAVGIHMFIPTHAHTRHIAEHCT